MVMEVVEPLNSYKIKIISQMHMFTKTKYFKVNIYKSDTSVHFLTWKPKKSCYLVE